MEAMPNTVDDIIARIKRMAKHWPRQCPNNDERLVMEIERLRALRPTFEDLRQSSAATIANYPGSAEAIFWFANALGLAAVEPTAGDIEWAKTEMERIRSSTVQTALDKACAEIKQLHELRNALAIDLEGANDELIEKSRTLELLLHLRPIADYDDGDGDVLWWRVPIDEPPWVGCPQCSGYTVELHTKDQPEPRMVMRGQIGGWPGDDYFTHWTPLPRPRLP